MRNKDIFLILIGPLILLLVDDARTDESELLGWYLILCLLGASIGLLLSMLIDKARSLIKENN